MARSSRTLVSVALEAALASPYWGEEDARQVLRAWRASGQSLTMFAAEHGIHRARLQRWKQRLVVEDAAEAGDVLFFPVQVGEQHEQAVVSGGVWTIALPGGVSVTVPCDGGADRLEQTLVAIRQGWWTC